MHILIDYRPALRQRTGVGEYVHQLAHALVNLDVNQFPLQAAKTCPGDPLAGPASIDRAGADEITLFSSSWKDRVREPPAGVRVADRRVPVALLNALWHRIEWPSIEVLAGGGYDVVHSAHPLLMPSRQAAQVITIHDLDFLRHPERTRGEIRRDYPELVRSHARRADAVVVSSRYTADEVERELGLPSHRVHLCPPGAPEWPARPAWPAEGYVLFVGTLEPRKNVQALLRAYEMVLGRNPAAPELLLAGRSGSESALVAQALSAPEFRGKVRHLGYVPDTERRRLYEEARVLVIPSLEEGFGFPALEAMKTGVPVVVSNRGALPELVDDAALIVDPEDIEGLAAAIERMIGDEAFARTSARRGLQRAQAFTWRATAVAMREVYREAAEVQKRRRGSNTDAGVHEREQR